MKILQTTKRVPKKIDTGSNAYRVPNSNTIYVVGPIFEDNSDIVSIEFILMIVHIKHKNKDPNITKRRLIILPHLLPKQTQQKDQQK